MVVEVVEVVVGGAVVVEVLEVVVVVVGGVIQGTCTTSQVSLPEYGTPPQ